MDTSHMEGTATPQNAEIAHDCGPEPYGPSRIPREIRPTTRRPLKLLKRPGTPSRASRRRSTTAPGRRPRAGPRGRSTLLRPRRRRPWLTVAARHAVGRAARRPRRGAARHAFAAASTAAAGLPGAAPGVGTSGGPLPDSSGCGPGGSGRSEAVVAPERTEGVGAWRCASQRPRLGPNPHAR